MGGHGVHVHGNEKNMQETDEEMQGKIQLIDTIKHSPNHWHMEYFAGSSWSTILGGAPTFAFGAIGATLSYSYYLGQASRNFYKFNAQVFWRLAFGTVLGLGVGYLRFGDRQRLHNAWVAERLRRRYPSA